jgi:hypothetical protein
MNSIARVGAIALGLMVMLPLLRSQEAADRPVPKSVEAAAASGPASPPGGPVAPAPSKADQEISSTTYPFAHANQKSKGANFETPLQRFLRTGTFGEKRYKYATTEFEFGSAQPPAVYGPAHLGFSISW